MEVRSYGWVAVAVEAGGGDSTDTARSVAQLPRREGLSPHGRPDGSIFVHREQAPFSGGPLSNPDLVPLVPSPAPRGGMRLPPTETGPERGGLMPVRSTSPDKLANPARCGKCCARNQGIGR